MKKLALIALFALSLCVVGCGGDPKKTSPQPTPVPNPTGLPK